VLALNVGKEIASGSSWMIAARWAVRSLGLISTIVLARLLTPEDFGLVAMGTLVVNFILAFTEAGQTLDLIRRTNPDRGYYDSAWTMSIGLNGGVGLLLIAIAPIAAWYFGEPRVTLLIQCLALKAIIGGFRNVGVIAFRKELQFGRQFQLQVLQRLGRVSLTVVLAIVIRNYWALVIGIVLGEMLSTWLTYWMHPFRPRLSVTRIREIWSFSVWMLVVNVGYFVSEADGFVVGAVAGARSMGTYNVASELANSPTEELIGPSAQALFPIYAKLLPEPHRLVETFLGVLAAFATISCAVGVGMALVADDVVAVLLGPKWAAAAPLMPWLALGGSFVGLGRAVNAIINVTGHARISAIRLWAFNVVLMGAMIVAGTQLGLLGIAIARTAVTFLFIPVTLYTVMQVLPVSARQIGMQLWRPIAASLCMAVMLLWLQPEMAQWVRAASIDSALLRLAASVIAGAATFSAAQLALWLLSGRPLGAERMALSYLAGVLNRMVRRPPPGGAGLAAEIAARNPGEPAFGLTMLSAAAPRPDRDPAGGPACNGAAALDYPLGRRTIFILGAPRSGTTWLGKMFDSHPAILYRHEPDIIDRGEPEIPYLCTIEEAPRYAMQARRWLARLARIKVLKTSGSRPVFRKSHCGGVAAWLRVLLIEILRTLQWLPVIGSLAQRFPVPDFLDCDANSDIPIVIKSVSCMGRVGILATASPDSRFILVVRHPCGQIASMLRGITLGKFEHQIPVLGLAATPQAQRRSLSRERLAQLPFIAQLAWSWVIQTEKAIEDLALAKHVKVVRYEDVAAAPADMARALFQFCGLDWKAETACFLRSSTRPKARPEGYYDVFREPLEAATKWRRQLSQFEIATIAAIVAQSPVCCQLYPDFVATGRAEQTVAV